MAFLQAQKHKAGRLAAYMIAAGLSLGFSGSGLAQTAAAAQATSTATMGVGAQMGSAAGPTKAAAEAVKPAGKADEAALLRPSALKDMGEGDVNAPVTIIEYASLTCSHCADFYMNTMPTLREKYIKTGKVHYIIREVTGDPRALAASMLTRCVAEDKFFPFLQLLFEKQDEWAFAQDGKTPLMRFAKMAGLDDKQFEACLTNEKMFKQFQQTTEQSLKQFDIQVTPTIFINGEKYQGALTPDQISAIVDKMLADKEAAKK